MISLFLLANLVIENHVEVYSKPMVRINGEEMILDLDESNLRDQIIGMKEGEVRTLKLGSNAIDVEIIKADATYESHTASAKEDAAFVDLF